jgi:hypothetical protein
MPISIGEESVVTHPFSRNRQEKVGSGLIDALTLPALTSDGSAGSMQYEIHLIDRSLDP